MSDKKPNVSNELIEKWSDVIDGKGEWKEFCESCPEVPKTQRALMAQMLENTEKDIIKESTTTSQLTTDYKPILIPMIRRILPAQIGPRVLGTWPMQAPSQLIFGLRAVYNNDSVNPVTYDNSVILTLAAGTAFATAGTAITGDGDNGNDGVGVVRYAEGNNVLVQVTSGTFVAGNGVDDAGTYAADVTTISVVYTNEALFNMLFKSYPGPYSTANGEVLTTAMKEVGFDIQSSTMTAQTYKLKAKWTLEMEEDMSALHSMNAEQILSQIATDEIEMEMNQTIIDKINTSATNYGELTWTYSTADGTWEVEKYLNLCAMIDRAAYSVATTTKRGRATFMIVSPSVLAAISAAGKLTTNTVDPINNVFVGRAMNMDVFCNIYATSNYILLGFKGATELDAGIFMGMYKPVTMIRGMGEESGQPRSFFRTRYGFVDNLMNTDTYYRRLTVSGLPT